MQDTGRTLLLLNTGVGENLGDRAMLTNTVRLLRERYPAWRLLVSARTPEFLVNEFRLTRVSFLIDCLSRWGVRSSRNPTASRLTQLAHAILGTAEFLVLALLAMAFKLTGKRPSSDFMEAEFVRSMLEADTVYFVGGGYLTDQGKLECRALLTTGLLAKWLKKPVILSGQGIGPFSTPLTRWLFRSVAGHAELIGLRDAGHGLNLLRSLGAPTSRAETVCDDALTLPPSKVFEAEPKTIGVHWRVSPHQADTVRVQAVLETLLDRLADEGWTILLFQFHEREKYESHIYSHWLTSRRWRGARIVRERDPRVLRAEVARCTVGIGMAYHFSVFALSAGVPVLGLWHKKYYREKIGGLMTAFEHPEWALDDRHVSERGLYTLINQMAASSYRPSLSARAATLAARHADWQSRVTERLSRR